MKKFRAVIPVLLAAVLIFTSGASAIAVAGDQQSAPPELVASIPSGGSMDTSQEVTFS